MTGFEYQVAAHMIAERDADLVQQGPAIIHRKLTLNPLDLGLFKDRKPKATLNGKDVEILGLQLHQGDVLVLS